MMQSFSNKNILLCITGGIAAYKSAEILRLFKKNGANPRYEALHLLLELYPFSRLTQT